MLTAELKLSLQARQDLEQALYAIYAPSESAWDQWRGGIITQVIDLLQIHGAEWMRQKLIKDTQEAILRRVSDTFEHRIECIPYTRDPDPSNENRGETPSVLAVSAGAGELRKDDVHAVYLNNKGQLRQSKKFETLAPVPEHRSDAERLRSSSNREEFKQWVQEKQPTVIVVGGWTIRTRELLGDVTNLTEGLNIPVIMVEDSTARLYRNSPKAAEEHHSLHEVAKYCLGLARYVQSPAAEFANLPPGVLESISFDPFQKLVRERRFKFQLKHMTHVAPAGPCGASAIRIGTEFGQRGPLHGCRHQQSRARSLLC